MPPSAGRTAFVTGGTGFVGLNLVKELMIRGWDVTALHRAHLGLEVCSNGFARTPRGRSDHRHRAGERHPAKEPTRVFHVAGNTNMWRGGNAEQTRDNVDGTRNVVEAALATRRAATGGDLIDFRLWSGGRARSPKRRPASPRIRGSTIRAPSGRRRRSRAPPWRSGLEVVIMQPGAIMGPYDIGTWSRLVRDGSRRQTARGAALVADLHACAGSASRRISPPPTRAQNGGSVPARRRK